MSPIVSVSIVVPRPGKFDEFVAIQREQYRRLRGKVSGLLGSRLYRSIDGRSAILLAMFETPEDQQRFAESADLLDHIARVRGLVERTGPGLYESAYEYGIV
jgi:hypothetical protein